MAAVAASAGMTWWARRYALRRNLLDQPGERRSHRTATPRGGGIAIVVVLLAGSLLAALFWPPQALYLVTFAIGLAMVAGIGWWDDHRPLPAWTRLLVHVLAAAMLAGLVWHATGNVWHALLALAFTASLINIWNFMDGINGLAASQAILVGAAMALVLPGPLSLAGWLLAAASLGFLPFNFPRARIFLGDVGSGALGFAIAALVCLATVATDQNWLVLLLPLTAFLVDAGFTLVSRMLAGERWMEAHNQHLYQRLVKRGTSHVSVTFAYSVHTALGITLFTIICISQSIQGTAAAVVVIAWLVCSISLWLLLRREAEKKGLDS